MAASCVQFSSWPALLISSTLFFAIVVFGEQQAVCYFYDGSVAPNHSPCNIEDANGQGSSCCNEMDTCLTNGYCLQTSGNFDNRLGTPSCTDRSWNAPSCPMDCKHAAMDGPISLYLASDDDGGKFCCGGSVNTNSGRCPNEPHTPFSLDSSKVDFNRTDGSPLLPNTTSFLRRVNSTDVSPATITATVTVTSSPSNASNEDITSVAAGAAVPLGVLLIAALIACGVLFRQLRNTKRTLDQHKAATYPSMSTEEPSMVRAVYSGNPPQELESRKTPVESDSRPIYERDI